MSEAGESMIQGAREALAFAKGEADPKDYRIHIPEDIDVKRIRGEFNMSQSKFAEFFGFSVRTLGFFAYPPTKVYSRDYSKL